MSWSGKFLSGLRMPTRSSLVTKVSITQCHFTSKIIAAKELFRTRCLPKIALSFQADEDP